MVSKKAEEGFDSLSPWRHLPIVEAHLHMGQDRDGSIIEESELLRMMDENGVEQGLVFPFNEKEPGHNFLQPNRRNLDACKHGPDRLMCGYRVNPKLDYKRLLEEAASEGVPVLKLHPTAQHFRIASAPMYKMFTECLRQQYKQAPERLSMNSLPGTFAPESKELKNFYPNQSLSKRRSARKLSMY